MQIKQKKRWVVVALALISSISLFLYWQNNHIQVTEIAYKNKEIPPLLEGFTIVHLSDLHNKEFGKNQGSLIRKIKQQKPNVIFITGDLVDRRRYDLETAMELIREAINIAPVYYVPGNHEAWSKKYDTIRQTLISVGVEVMDNRKIGWEEEGKKINIIGVMDPDFLTKTYQEGTDTSLLEKDLDQLVDKEAFTILLSHRPELIDLYAEKGVDLGFTGHAHGGQVRIPFIGAVIAPDQGFFPTYTSGSYRTRNTTLIVSRGLGNSLFPFRIFNRPEVVVVKLAK